MAAVVVAFVRSGWVSRQELYQMPNWENMDMVDCSNMVITYPNIAMMRARRLMRWCNIV